MSACIARDGRWYIGIGVWVIVGSEQITIFLLDRDDAVPQPIEE